MKRSRESGTKSTQPPNGLETLPASKKPASDDDNKLLRSVYFPPQMLDRLDEIAAYYGETRSAIIRRFLNEGIENFDIKRGSQ